MMQLLTVPVVLLYLFGWNPRWSYSWAVNIATQYIVIDHMIWIPWGLWMLYRYNCRHMLWQLGAHFLMLLFVWFELNDFVPIWGVSCQSICFFPVSYFELESTKES